MLPHHLPPKLQELNLTGNLITDIMTRGQEFSSLIHLGISYNMLTDESLPVIRQSFPKLFCLDISHNRLESITKTLKVLLTLPGLKMLYLIGNPLMLSVNYRQVIRTKL